MYYILHIPSGTYLYTFLRDNTRFVLAEFSSIKQAQELLATSLLDWKCGTLYFYHETRMLNRHCAEVNSQLMALWKDKYVKEEFEIIKKD